MEHSTTVTDAIWTQFGASLDRLENAINVCPEKHWDTFLGIWHRSFHCIFWTDYYLSTEPNNLEPPKLFTFSEFDLRSKQQNRTYTKTETLDYLEHCRNKTKQIIGELTPNKMNSLWINEHKNYTLFEVLLYNMRHIQHHSAQLNLLLRQIINDAPC